MGGVPPALLARRALAVPGGGLPSLSPVAPAFSLLFCPLSPQPALAERSSPVGKGETKVILCKGLRPLHPRAEPGLNGNRKGTPVPSGGLASGGFPNLAGSAGVSGTLQGAAFLAARSPLPFASSLPYPPLAERRLGGRASQGQRPLPRAKKPRRIHGRAFETQSANYFTLAKYLMVRTIWLV